MQNTPETPANASDHNEAIKRAVLASPFTRREWESAFAIMGSMADDLLPTVHDLCALGWRPSGAAHALVSALDDAKVTP